MYVFGKAQGPTDLDRESAQKNIPVSLRITHSPFDQRYIDKTPCFDKPLASVIQGKTTSTKYWINHIRDESSRLLTMFFFFM